MLPREAVGRCHQGIGLPGVKVQLEQGDGIFKTDAGTVSAFVQDIFDSG
jgi:hypothetical protein